MAPASMANRPRRSLPRGADPAAPCLVYPLMEGGSLEDRLLLDTAFAEPNGAHHASARLVRLAQLGFATPPPPLT